MEGMTKEVESKPDQFMERLERDLLEPGKDLSSLSPEAQFKLISDKVAQHPEAITPRPEGKSNDLLERLKKSKETGVPLKIKLGIDPTGPDLHLGHAVPLLMLKRFQQMGHGIQFVVGDFTAKIGDPSGRTKERPPLTNDDIKRNMSSYFEQASRILDLGPNADIETHYNSEWLGPKSMSEWLPILQRISASQIFEREDFQLRIKAGGTISMAELMYALFMAYDSVVLKPDIEVGGIDQLLNLHWCRELMRLEGQKSEIFIITDILPGTSGELDSSGRLVKMSKSRKNYIAITESPQEMYGKVMSIPDRVMWVWFKELTDISAEDLDKLKMKVSQGEIHPMETKRLLARVVVGTVNGYSREIISSAEAAFNRKFGKEKLLVPEDIKVVQASSGEKLIEVLSKVSGESKGNIRRMAEGGEGGIRILEEDKYVPLKAEGMKLFTLEPGREITIRMGKRRFFKIITG